MVVVMTTINPFNKEHDQILEVVFRLCHREETHPKVQELYNKYQGECEKYLPLDIAERINTEHKYYVYAWYIQSDIKKYFYVGKGTGFRYKHILEKLTALRNGEKYTRNSRYKHMALLQQIYGIDCEIVIDHLNDFEALVYEQCLKLKLIENGEVLLNVEGIPDDSLPDGWKTDTHITIPTLENSPFRRRYLNDSDLPYFDEVDESTLKVVWFYPYYLTDDQQVEKDRNVIINWLISHGAKILNYASRKGISVIVQGYLPEDTYRKYRNQNFKILSSIDVRRFITDASNLEGISLDDAPVILDPESRDTEDRIAQYIIERLVLLGADEKDIRRTHYQDEQIIEYMSEEIRYKVLKNNKGAWIHVPLDYAADIEHLLSNMNSWCGKYRFSSIKELELIEPFFNHIYCIARSKQNEY